MRDGSGWKGVAATGTDRLEVTDGRITQVPRGAFSDSLLPGVGPLRCFFSWHASPSY